MPSFVEDKLLQKLETVEDANSLGQFLLFTQMISRAGSHPNLQSKPGTKIFKFPKFLAHDLPIFNHNGCYILENQVDKSQQKKYMFAVFAFMIFLTLFNIYPFWMQNAIWQAFCYYFISYFAIGGLRITLWVIGYHFGFVFWLFPNYRKSYNPTRFMWPLAAATPREDARDTTLLLFRLISLSFMFYLAWIFMQDEKNLEDLKEFTSKGVSDLLDYSKDWEFGALKLGNNTESSFKEKIKRKMETDEGDIEIEL